MIGGNFRQLISYHGNSASGKLSEFERKARVEHLATGLAGSSNYKLGNSRPCESQVRIRVWDEIVQVARFGETSPIRYVNFGAGRPVQLYVRPGKPACPQNPACP